MLISKSDREVIRELAKKQLEYANHPDMVELGKQWKEHNDLKGTFTPVTIEKGTFSHELIRPLQCEGTHARWIEYWLLDSIIQHEDVGDDFFIGPIFHISTDTYFKPFGIDVIREKPKSGDSVGFHTVLTIDDLEKDFHKLKKSEYGYDTEETKRKIDLLEDAIGDLMPIKLEGFPFYFTLTQWLVNLMGMENMFMAMYDYPDLLHEMLRMVTDDYVDFMKLLEKDGILKPNNQHLWVAQGTFSPNSYLPKSEGKTLTTDIWGYMDSQETVGISSEMFEEFYFPYYKKVADLYGLLNYGCCEPVDKIWDNCISKFTNLRKVSISPWCDEEFMGQRLQGRSIIYHRKPSPNYICLSEFDEEGLKEHIKTTCLAASGCKLEFSYRDVYSLNGEKWRANRAYRIIKETVDKYWRY